MVDVVAVEPPYRERHAVRRLAACIVLTALAVGCLPGRRVVRGGEQPVRSKGDRHARGHPAVVGPAGAGCPRSVSAHGDRRLRRGRGGVHRDRLPVRADLPEHRRRALQRGAAASSGDMDPRGRGVRRVLRCRGDRSPGRRRHRVVASRARRGMVAARAHGLGGRPVCGASKPPSATARPRGARAAGQRAAAAARARAARRPGAQHLAHQRAGERCAASPRRASGPGRPALATIKDASHDALRRAAHRARLASQRCGRAARARTATRRARSAGRRGARPAGSTCGSMPGTAGPVPCRPSRARGVPHRARSADERDPAHARAPCRGHADLRRRAQRRGERRRDRREWRRRATASLACASAPKRSAAALEAGPRPGGGFEVAARLPTGPA